VADSKHEKHEEAFKVIDRRHFTGDGELRKDVVEQERREEEAAKKAAPPPRPTAQPSAEAGASGKGILNAAGEEASSAVAAGLGAGAGLAAGAGDANEPSHNFQMLVDFLTRNAAAMLGGMPDPRTGQAYLDLEGAREMIDMLDVLRDKTRGNLAKADDDLLIEVLGSLKLTFMEVSKAAAEAMAKKAAAKK
jgi:Domain of unknown function (DUF1844)